MDTTQTTRFVKERYGQAARQVSAKKSACCCGGDADPITINLYEPGQTTGLPEEAVLASLGCGNPTALAELHEGETVLDLGSGGGIDVLLSAKRVGPSGKAYGIDMTDEMLELARQNQQQAGVTNAEFIKGSIESIPLPDASVDVIISNCVINLSADKDAVFREAFRVLRPGGRLGVADIVTRKELPEEVRTEIEFWTSCVSGALQEDDYRKRLERAGFSDVGIHPIRVYTQGEALDLLSPKIISEAVAAEVAGSLFSAFVSGRKGQ